MGVNGKKLLPSSETVMLSCANHRRSVHSWARAIKCSKISVQGGGASLGEWHFKVLKVCDSDCGTTAGVKENVRFGSRLREIG